MPVTSRGDDQPGARFPALISASRWVLGNILIFGEPLRAAHLLVRVLSSKPVKGIEKAGYPGADAVGTKLIDATPPGSCRICLAGCFLSHRNQDKIHAEREWGGFLAPQNGQLVRVLVQVRAEGKRHPVARGRFGARRLALDRRARRTCVRDTRCACGRAGTPRSWLVRVTLPGAMPGSYSSSSAPSSSS